DALPICDLRGDAGGQVGGGPLAEFGDLLGVLRQTLGEHLHRHERGRHVPVGDQRPAEVGGPWTERRQVERVVAAEQHQRGAAVVTGAFSSEDRKSTRLNSSHVSISYAVFCLKKKTTALNVIIRHISKTVQLR